MDQLIDDLIHAQPDVLFILAGLVLIGIGVVGSIKTYIDPGKYGRIAALCIGTILLVVGFILYSKQMQPAGGGTEPAIAQSGQPAPAAGPTTQTCKFTTGPDAGKVQRFPRARPFVVGAPCFSKKGNHGVGIDDQPSLGMGPQ